MSSSALLLCLVLISTTSAELLCTINATTSSCETDGTFNTLTGTEIEGASNIEGLSATKCNILRIETTAFRDFSKLLMLNLSNNLIKEIEMDVLSSLPGLSVLDLSKNSITVLHPDAFASNTNLSLLDLSDNVLFLSQLQKVILPKTQLLDLYLNNNNPDFGSIRMSSEDGAIEGTDTLVHRIVISHMADQLQAVTSPENNIQFLVSDFAKRLFLTHNNLAVLPQDALFKCRRIYYLKLNHNRLETLHSNTFSKNVVLRILHLQNNRLSSLPDGIFKNCKKLSTINLNDNRLKSLSSPLFNLLTDLGALRLANNEISSLPVGIFDMNIKLQTLDLGGNALKTLSPNLLGNNVKLKALDFSVNKLTSFTYGMIDQLNDLQKLRLHKNEIARLDALFFMKPQLEELTIFCNKLTALPAGVDHVSVKSLPLHGNPWKCGCLNRLLSFGISHIIGDVNTKVPLICVVDKNVSKCDDAPVEGPVLNQWNKAQKNYQDKCNFEMERLLIL